MLGDLYIYLLLWNSYWRLWRYIQNYCTKKHVLWISLMSLA